MPAPAGPNEGTLLHSLSLYSSYLSRDEHSRRRVAGVYNFKQGLKSSIVLTHLLAMVLPDLQDFGQGQVILGEETAAGTPVSRDGDLGEITLNPARDEHYCAIRVPKWDRATSDGLLVHYLKALGRRYTWKVLSDEDGFWAIYAIVCSVSAIMREDTKEFPTYMQFLFPRCLEAPLTFWTRAKYELFDVSGEQTLEHNAIELASMEAELKDFWRRGADEEDTTVSLTDEETASDGTVEDNPASGEACQSCLFLDLEGNTGCALDGVQADEEMGVFLSQFGDGDGDGGGYGDPSILGRTDNLRVKELTYAAFSALAQDGSLFGALLHSDKSSHAMVCEGRGSGVKPICHKSGRATLLPSMRSVDSSAASHVRKMSARWYWPVNQSVSLSAVKEKTGVVLDYNSVLFMGVRPHTEIGLPGVKGEGSGITRAFGYLKSFRVTLYLRRRMT